MLAVSQEDQGIIEGAELGQVIGGKYQLERYISSGASGAVYRARHRILEKVVALKILGPRMARSAAHVELFKREARAASRIDHPNSVRVLDFGEDASGLLYIVMELVEGPDLLRVLNDEFPLEHERVIEIMSQVLAALSVAHALGVVHRDLKPENILVLSGTNDEGNTIDLIKICDFGVAQLSPASVPQLLPRTSLEQPTTIDIATLVGTPEYMSPEQARSEELDARSDVYSAGVLLFQLATGRLPFIAGAVDVVAMMQCSAQPPYPSSFKGVDPRFDAICLKAMSKEPKDRYQSAREMRAAIRRLTLTPGNSFAPTVVQSVPAPDSNTMSPPPSLPAAASSQPRRRRSAFALAMTLASSAAAAAYLWHAPVEHTAERGSVHGDLSLQPARVATSEQSSQRTVARSEPQDLPPAVATTPSSSVSQLVERASVPRLTRRMGRSGQRASTSTAATAIALPEAPSIGASGGAVESSESPIPDRAARIAPEPAPSSTQEPSARAAVQSDLSNLSAPQATARSLSDAIPVPAKKGPATVKTEPLAAVARIQDVNVRGSLATSVVQRAMDRARPLLAACYAQAAKAAGRNGFGPINIGVEFDERGRARRPHADGGVLPGLDHCVTEVAGNLVAAQAPDTGTVKATWHVSFER